MTRLPKGAQWIAHDGARARVRRMKQATRGLTVPPEHQARLDVLPIAGSTPDLAHFRRCVLFEAKQMADSTGIDFADVLDNALTKIEARMRPAVVESVPMAGGEAVA